MGQFAEATRRAFGFLRALGFSEQVAEFWPPGDFPARPRAITCDPSAPLGAAHVGFERAGIAVDVYHDPRAEVQVAIGRVGGDGRSRFDLHEILTTQGADPQRYGGIYASATTPIATALERMAEAAERYARPWLVGEAAAYDRVLTRRGRAPAPE